MPTPAVPSNLAVVSGHVGRAPASRTAAHGTVVDLDVVTALADGTTATVPVRIEDALVPRALELAVDEPVVIIGVVRRRFFQSAGRTVSRTEVVAAQLFTGRRTSSARKALAAVLDLAA